MLATAKTFVGADLVLDAGYAELVSLYRASKSA